MTVREAQVFPLECKDVTATVSLLCRKWNCFVPIQGKSWYRESSTVKCNAHRPRYLSEFIRDGMRIA